MYRKLLKEQTNYKLFSKLKQVVAWDCAKVFNAKRSLCGKVKVYLFAICSVAGLDNAG